MPKYVYESSLGYRYVSETDPDECADKCIKRLLTDADIRLLDEAMRASSEFLYELKV